MKLTTHLPPVQKSKNGWSYTSTPQYAFMAWCSVRGSTGTTFITNKLNVEGPQQSRFLPFTLLLSWPPLKYYQTKSYHFLNSSIYCNWNKWKQFHKLRFHSGMINVHLLSRCFMSAISNKHTTQLHSLPELNKMASYAELKKWLPAHQGESAEQSSTIQRR
jgi:hypothetical protein